MVHEERDSDRTTTACKQLLDCVANSLRRLVRRQTCSRIERWSKGGGQYSPRAYAPEGGQDAVLSGVLGTGVGTGQPQDMS